MMEPVNLTRHGWRLPPSQEWFTNRATLPTLVASIFQRMHMFPDGKCSLMTNREGTKFFRVLRNRSYIICLSWASDVVRNSPATMLSVLGSKCSRNLQCGWVSVYCKSIIKMCVVLIYCKIFTSHACTCIWICIHLGNITKFSFLNLPIDEKLEKYSPPWSASNSHPIVLIRVLYESRHSV